MISTLLVANRGEIAVRIIRTAHALGIRTVAVYSDADRDAPHVREADVAVHIGPTPATQSYLSVDAVLDAARRTGADAVHPGYGFLSERAELARAVAEAGLTFVGPTAEVMERMGRKDTARDIAIAAGVPVVPRAVVDEGDREAPRGATQFPVLVKAAAGGGGKGMRIVRDPADLEDALAAARREARSAFGDDTVLVERYVEHGRHVEVQVLADHHGNVVHLYERDCSTQRRHQKVIEEAPAPTISEATRKVLTESAVALAKQVGYNNAGTVEFLVEEPEGGRGSVSPANVFFLEMNTRLQVEHPVTELVVSAGSRGSTGAVGWSGPGGSGPGGSGPGGSAPPLDLVALQLLVAAGEPLPFTQDDVHVQGHAFEARVYAEDAFNGFLPQAGVASYVRWSPRARNDEALESGSVVSTAYDPMLGKVIVRGPTREAARQALVTALDDTAILGLTTNLGFLRALAASDELRDSEIDTAWLDRHPDAVRPPAPETAALLGAWAVAAGGGAGSAGGGAGGGPRAVGPFDVGDGWRLAGPPAPVNVELAVAGTDRVLAVDRTGGRVTEGERSWTVREVAAEPGVVRLEVDGIVHEATVLGGPHAVEVAHLGHTFRFDRPDVFGAAGAGASSDGTVVAPMPGTVLAVHVSEGQAVEEGDVLGVMEAMKMELTLKAPLAGTVTGIGAATGDQVPLGKPLFVVTPEGDSAP